MQMTVSDAARLLCVTEEKVQRWIRDQGLPANRIGQHFQLNRAEVLEWATAHRMPLPAGAFQETAAGEPLPSLVAALQVGGIHHAVGGIDKREVLRSAVAKLRIRDDFDREALLSVLLARESLGSTGIGDGIAIPHVRNPIVLRLSPPAVTLCFLETPVDFGAVDARPVHTLFLITSPSVEIHLHLLSRLSFGLRDPEVRAALAVRESPERILEVLGRLEKGLTAPREHPAE
jgi:PTS system nitrogen regulatory IIA component